MKFRGKTVWITGASSGIGEAIAYELASKQNHLILSARREDALEGVKKECERLGGEATVIPIDLADSASIETAFRLAKKSYDSVDVLINNGGISQRSLVAETPVDIDRKILEINFFGTVDLTKKVLPWMVETGGGTLAATSSMVGRFGFPLRSAYAASKHALHGFFESLYLENYQNNIKTCLICPGRIRTQFSLNALKSDGKAHAQMDEGLEAGISPKRAAKKIVKGLEKGRKEIWVGGKEILMMYFRKYVPSLFFKIAKKVKPT